MRKLSTLIAVLATALTAGAVSADAILFGTPDGNDHKGVGYIVFYDSGNVPITRCTGSLVSTRVLLTAGHCAGTLDFGDGPRTPVRAQVWFDSEIRARNDYPAEGGVSCTGFRGWPCSGGDSYGVPFAHPDFDFNAETGAVVNDIGVVVLAKQQKSKHVLALAPVKTLERTTPGLPMTIIGFGTQSVAPPPEDQRQRMRGQVTFLRTEDGSQEFDDPAFADFTNSSPGVASCVGDSGGPVLDAKERIVALMALVNPVVDGFCQGDAYHYRTDTADSKQFLAGFGVRFSGSGGRDDRHEDDDSDDRRDRNNDDRDRNDRDRHGDDD